jgi:hypothetical protein
MIKEPRSQERWYRSGSGVALLLSAVENIKEAAIALDTRPFENK